MASQLDRKPSKCVVFEDDPRGVTAAHNCTMIAAALIGARPAYDLVQTDLAVGGFNELSVINLRARYVIKDPYVVVPLHYAVQVSAMQTVKLLIKSKVDVNVADNEGWTPLHVAMQSRNRDIAKVLLVNGADKTRRTQDGKTALDIGLCYGKDFKAYDLAKLLKLVPANSYN